MLWLYVYLSYRSPKSLDRRWNGDCSDFKVLLWLKTNGVGISVIPEVKHELAVLLGQILACHIWNEEVGRQDSENTDNSCNDKGPSFAPACLDGLIVSIHLPGLWIDLRVKHSTPIAAPVLPIAAENP